MGIVTVGLVGLGGGLVAASVVSKNRSLRTRVTALLVGGALLATAILPQFARVDPPASAHPPALAAGSGR